MTIELFTLNSDHSSPNTCPFASRVIFALKHKQLPFQENKSTMKEVNDKINKLTNGKWTKVPAIKLDDEVVFDSLDIVDRLEAKYPDKSIFPYGRNYSTLVSSIVLNNLIDFIKIIYVHRIAELDGDDKIKTEERIHTAFKESNEELAKAKGIKINSREDSVKIFFEDRDTVFKRLTKFLKPFDTVLEKSTFLEGPLVAYSDFILYSHVHLLRQFSEKDYDDLVKNLPNLDKWVQSLAYLD